MADLSEKPIEEIQVGDVVLSYDEFGDAMVPAVVVKLHKPFAATHYYVINDQLRATENHPVLLSGEWVSVSELAIGDRIGSKGHGMVVTSLRRVDQPTLVYNFQVSKATYVADGVIVHNKEECEEYTQYCPTCGEGP